MLLDPDRSWALLVGTSVYRRASELADIPAVVNGVRDLAAVLTDELIGRLKPSHCISLEDPEDEHQVAEALDRAASWASDTLIFYYAGHGLLDDSPRRELHLGLTDTALRLVVSSSIPFAVVRDFISQSSAKTRVVILDCCYSGIAAEHAMGSAISAEVRRLVPVEGSYVLTSSAATRTSMAPPGAHYTAFTGALLRVLREGIAGGPRELDLESIYLQVKRQLVAEGFPEPQRLVSNTAHYLALVLNRAWESQTDRALAPPAEVRTAVASSAGAPWHAAIDRGGESVVAWSAIPRLSLVSSSPSPVDQTRHLSSPTAWRRWVAAEMRKLRQAAGMSQGDVAQAIGCQVRKLSLVENGRRAIDREELRRALALFGVPEDRWSPYLDGAETARSKGWWEAYGPHIATPWVATFVGLEQGAERIRTYHPARIHGLLQTPDYAAAVIREHPLQFSEERVRRMVELRMKRQATLWRDFVPLQLWVLLGEAAMRNTTGPPQMMRHQLEHVVAVANRFDNLTIQVVPYDRTGPEAQFGAFTLMTFPFPDDPGLVYVEQPYGPTWLEDEPQIDGYSLLFQQISMRALSPDESLEMVQAYVEESSQE